jgi:ssDNA-binding Zn-finger/Zn-ribbon topoisomerase 1
MKAPQTKSERMELRREIGNRLVAGPYVPPYHHGADYLVAHACFECRKSWKLAEENTAICPDCGNSVHWMGRAFKAPKKSDIEQWKKVEALWRAGFRFLPNTGWRQVEPYPDRFRDVEKFVQLNPNHPFRFTS